MERHDDHVLGAHRDVGGVALPDNQNLTVTVHQEDGNPAEVWLCYAGGRHTEVVRLRPDTARELGNDLCNAAHLLDRVAMTS
jgi:hypothetical protein